MAEETRVYGCGFLKSGRKGDRSQVITEVNRSRPMTDQRHKSWRLSES